MAGLVELRPTPDICAAKCRDHFCFKGNERVEGFKVQREYMRSFVNPTEFIESQRKKLEDEKYLKKQELKLVHFS